MPGDKFKVNASTFSRTAPLNTAAFARMKQYFNFYFVPYRLLYRDFPSFVVQQSKSSKAATDINADVVVPSLLPYVVESDLQHICHSGYAGDGNTAPLPLGSSVLGNFLLPLVLRVCSLLVSCYNTSATTKVLVKICRKRME